MAKVQIQFVNGEPDVVDDPVKGRPCVVVTLRKPDGTELCFGQWALVDTGSDITIISEALLLGHDDLAREKSASHTQYGVVESYSVSGLELEIAGLDLRIPVAVKTRSQVLPAIDVVIGRDVLSQCRLIYHPSNGECTLEIMKATQAA